MHAKIVVADDTAFVGSYNHSRSGEENAENVLAIEGQVAADPLMAFIEETAARYSR
jgi:phosphatidylserine/phosphatidylglycerophosphate/cardiolipin synthase-like enzyme